jgi:broad specificity phosphatase PhoE
MRLNFARHGESEANVWKVFWNQHEKYGLTEIGREQAQILSENLTNVLFRALYCNPVLCAIQTAEIIGSNLGLKP